MTEALRIAKLRRRAKKLGLSFFKSRWRLDSPDNLGGFRIVEGQRDAYTLIDGARFELDLADVERIISAWEGKAND